LKPSEICKQTETSKAHFRKVVDILAGQIDINDCDQIMEEFEKFTAEAKHKTGF